MKLKSLLAILPVVTVLAGCSNELKLSGATDNTLAGTQLTATPSQLVVYPNDRPSIPDGKPVFAKNCASCHGADGMGTADAALKFDQTWARQIKPVDIYRLAAFGYVENHPKFGSATGNLHPHLSGKLTVRELWDVTVYTRALGQPALTNEEISAMLPVFGANCAVCHGTKGDGEGSLAPHLDPMPANFQRFDRFFNRTDDVLFDHIANGIRWEGMPNFLGKKDSKKGVYEVTFDEPYIRKLVQYVHQFHVNNQPVLTANAEGAAPEASAAPADSSKAQTSVNGDNKPEDKDNKSTKKDGSGER